MDNIYNSIKNTGFPKHNELDSGAKGAGNPFSTLKPDEFYCASIILKFCNQSFPWSMTFGRIPFNYTFYLNKREVGIKFCNLIESGSVDIFIWKIIKQIAESENI